MDNFGSFFTVNGIPLYTYGLIGATTLLLTYSVFRDDSAPKESESSSSGYFTSPTQTPAKEEEAPAKEEEVPEVKTEESPPPPVETPAPTVGGKRKRTKRRRNKNKKTKRSRK